MTEVLLTGSSGYIGKHITLQLLEAGFATVPRQKRFALQ
jgi:nucleoside-diphosphate-sugar epimerase